MLTNERLLMLLFRPQLIFSPGCSLVKTATTHTVSGGATERCPTLLLLFLPGRGRPSAHREGRAVAAAPIPKRTGFGTQVEMQDRVNWPVGEWPWLQNGEWIARRQGQELETAVG